MEKEMEIVKQVAKKVQEAGGNMYFVGGFVRDRLLGKESKDIDVEVHGIKEEQFVSILKSFGEVDLVGESFGVYLIKGVDVDFAMPRQERKTGDKHTDFDVTVDPFIGTYEASKRRDFTMNAIMEDIMTGDVIDHFGGVQDIHNRVIRFVDKVTFQEDALRVLRAIQFSARFGFEIGAETQEVMKGMSMEFLAKERVYIEIEKGMTKGFPMVFVSQLKRYPNVMNILPSVESAELGRMLKGNLLPQNVVLMSLHMEDVLFESLVQEMIQDKQGRKLAVATRSFVLDVQKSETAHAMALTVARHRGFVENHASFIESNGNTLFDKTTLSLLKRMMMQKRHVEIEIDGTWLQAQGVKPSKGFKDILDEAHALSFLGFTEEQIRNRICWL